MPQPGTRDLAPAGLARLCGGLHLYHSFDRRECSRAHTYMHRVDKRFLLELQSKEVKEVTENFTVVTVTGYFIYYRISAARLFATQR